MEIEEPQLQTQQKLDSILDPNYIYTSLGDYKVMRPIGEGGTSKIKLAYNTKTH